MQEEKVNITLEYSFKVGEQTFGVAISFCQIFCLYEYVQMYVLHKKRLWRLAIYKEFNMDIFYILLWL